MRIRGVISTTVVSLAIVAGVGSVARADQAPASLSPDRVLKGTTPTVTITGDKNIPDPKDIKRVRVGGQDATVQEPRAADKLLFQLPKLDIVGRADVEVTGKDDKPVVVGQLTYVESLPPVIPEASNRDLALLIVYVALIVLLPVICTIYDMRKSYQERNKVLDKLDKLVDKPSVQDIQTLMGSMDKGPTGFTGLTRGLVAVTLILVVGIAVFHLVVFGPSKPPDIAEKLLMLLAGTLTSITGFYFGTKAANEAAQQTAPSGGQTGSSAAPKIGEVTPESAVAGTTLTVRGEGFGDPQGKGTVKFGNTPGEVTKWTGEQINVTVPANVASGPINIVVTNDKGAPSPPRLFTIVKA